MNERRIQRLCMDVQCFTGKLQEPNKTLGRCMDAVWTYGWLFDRCVWYPNRVACDTSRICWIETQSSLRVNERRRRVRAHAWSIATPAVWSHCCDDDGWMETE